MPEFQPITGNVWEDFNECALLWTKSRKPKADSILTLCFCEVYACFLRGICQGGH